MKKITLLFLLVLTGCTFKNSDNLSSNININIESNLEANITVGEKISGIGHETIILGILRLPSTKYSAHGVTTNATIKSIENISYKPMSYILNYIEFAKGKAIHDAITSSNADLIINPQFIITEEDFFLYKTIKCEVSGWKGTIKTIK